VCGFGEAKKVECCGKAAFLVDFLLNGIGWFIAAKPHVWLS